MLKKCTNSACRKSFSPVRSGGKCPWCGKEYPRFFRNELVLYSYGTSKLLTIKAVRMLADCGLGEAKSMTESATKQNPLRVRIHCPEKRSEAEELLKKAKARYRFC